MGKLIRTIKNETNKNYSGWGEELLRTFWVGKLIRTIKNVLRTFWVGKLIRTIKNVLGGETNKNKNY